MRKVILAALIASSAITTAHACDCTRPMTKAEKVAFAAKYQDNWDSHYASCMRLHGKAKGSAPLDTCIAEQATYAKLY